MAKRILIIDDEEHIRRMMRLTLESAGYEVREAADGFAGLKLLQDETPWDVVILDQRMPGMDGLATLERIKQHDPATRVLMATAYASIELAVEAMKLGASDFVRKPMTPETLRNSVSALLQKQVVTDPVRRQSTPVPLVETVTMNGFTIIDPSKNDWHSPNERRFEVLSPNGTSHEVVVKIDEEAVAYVQRMTRRQLSPDSSFWTTQARRLLSDYLWNNGDVPRMKFLTLTEINRDELPVAERWKDD